LFVSTGKGVYSPQGENVMASVQTVSSLITRIQNHFLNGANVTLSIAEAQRRFGVDRATCEAILDFLADATVLVRTPDGRFSRLLPRAARHAA
jgi:hypothetical protein